MTAIRVATDPPTPAAKFATRGGELLTARITPAGRVLVHQVIASVQPDAWGQLQVFVRAAVQFDLGQVDPDDVDAWRHAEAMLIRAGYQVVKDWTTVDRLPAAQLRRGPRISLRTVRGER